MKKPKIPKQVTDVLLELGIELLKTLKDMNAQKKSIKPKKKGVKNDTNRSP
jgi:hypothetical protein